jgi:tRNA 2-selenouridine synthase
MIQELKIEDCIALRRKGELVLIDVRSPSEYEDATIPGSVNIPIFSDAERAEIGTLYKQVGTEAAKQRGLEVVSAKLPAFVKQFAELPGNKAVFCWRGGMRSKTTATVLSLMDIQVHRLLGGYRAYRQWVVEQLNTISFKPQAIVLHGYTGTGKTVILRRLKEKGFPVLDLEFMAGHRGSIFGEIGLRARNQKTFEALLVEDLFTYQHERCVLFEAESKRIGKVVLPELIMQKKQEGIHVLIELPVEKRVRQIIQDYQPWNHPERCLEAFRRIKSAIHTPIAFEIESCLKQEKYEPAVEMLLLYYYDLRYAHKREQYEFDPALIVKANDLEEAYQAVERMAADLTRGNRIP